jgi:hypothetical protein
MLQMNQHSQSLISTIDINELSHLTDHLQV